jgi:hypothetical protein
MADTHPAQALDVIKRVEMMCDFLKNPIITQAIENGVPVTMPRLPGALGFDIPLWVGLGMVGRLPLMPSPNVQDFLALFARRARAERAFARDLIIVCRMMRNAAASRKLKTSVTCTLITLRAMPTNSISRAHGTCSLVGHKPSLPLVRNSTVNAFNSI